LVLIDLNASKKIFVVFLLLLKGITPYIGIELNFSISSVFLIVLLKNSLKNA
jgi:hypothetical protein